MKPGILSLLQEASFGDPRWKIVAFLVIIISLFKFKTMDFNPLDHLGPGLEGKMSNENWIGLSKEDMEMFNIVFRSLLDRKRKAASGLSFDEISREVAKAFDFKEPRQYVAIGMLMSMSIQSYGNYVQNNAIKMLVEDMTESQKLRLKANGIVPDRGSN